VRRGKCFLRSKLLFGEAHPPASRLTHSHPQTPHPHTPHSNVNTSLNPTP
jgi:hypothetical protein